MQMHKMKTLNQTLIQLKKTKNNKRTDRYDTGRFFAFMKKVSTVFDTLILCY
jgi:hypothetical protein